MFVYIIHMYTHIHKDAQRYTYTQFENSSLLPKYKNMPDAETCLESVVSLATAFIWHCGILTETRRFFCAGTEFAEILAGGERLTSLQNSPKPCPDMPSTVVLRTRCIYFISHSTGRNYSEIVHFFKEPQKKDRRKTMQLSLVLLLWSL